MMFAQCNDLKRKRRTYKKKEPASPDTSEQEEADESQIGSIHHYNHHGEMEG